METNNDVADISNTAENEELNSTENTETTVEETKEESIDEVKAKLVKAEELANNQRIRAEKAEKKAKETVQTESRATKNMPLKDIRALQDVHDEDVDEVIEWAEFKKISIAEAKKHLKGRLVEKEEQRKTAAATNTGTARRGSVKVSDEEIVDQSEKGQIPEDPETLAKARFNLKKKK